MRTVEVCAPTLPKTCNPGYDLTCMIPTTRPTFQYSRIILIMILLLLAACGSKPSPTVTPTAEPATQTPDFTSTPGPTDTPAPTDTPTPEPLGSSKNPLQFGFLLPSGKTSLPPETTQVLDALAKATGYAIQAYPAASYSALLAGMADGKVHIAFLPPFTYLQAKVDGSAAVLLVANHYGVYAYGTQFLTNIFENYTPFFNPSTEKNLGDGGQALAQFSSKRPCLVEPHSAAGYVVPLGILNQAGITTQDPVLAQTFTGVVRALYTRQICDFGVTYAFSGDPRTASSVQADMPDAVQKVIVVWRSGAVIPNLNVSTGLSLTGEMRQKLSTALIGLVRSTEGQKQLTAAADGYSIDDFKPIGDEFYAALQPYVTSSGALLSSLLGN